MTSQQCICGRKKRFEDCCGRFLSGKQRAKTPEQLMRSRYSAYALGGHGEYLLATWFPATAGGLTVPELSQKTTDWQRLEVIESSQAGDQGTVEFRAWFSAPDHDQGLDCMHEVSEFSRVGGRWFYVGGRVL